MTFQHPSWVFHSTHPLRSQSLKFYPCPSPLVTQPLMAVIGTFMKKNSKAGLFNPKFSPELHTMDPAAHRTFPHASQYVSNSIHGPGSRLYEVPYPCFPGSKCPSQPMTSFLPTSHRSPGTSRFPRLLNLNPHRHCLCSGVLSFLPSPPLNGALHLQSCFPPIHQLLHIQSCLYEKSSKGILLSLRPPFFLISHLPCPSHLQAAPQTSVCLLAPPGLH